MLGCFLPQKSLRNDNDILHSNTKNFLFQPCNDMILCCIIDNFGIRVHQMKFFFINGKNLKPINIQG